MVEIAAQSRTGLFTPLSVFGWPPAQNLKPCHLPRLRYVRLMALVCGFHGPFHRFELPFQDLDAGISRAAAIANITSGAKVMSLPFLPLL